MICSNIFLKSFKVLGNMLKLNQECLIHVINQSTMGMEKWLKFDILVTTLQAITACRGLEEAYNHVSIVCMLIRLNCKT